MSPKCTVIKNELRDMIAQLEQEHDIKLTNTQKIVLSINGPVTPILDVLDREIDTYCQDNAEIQALKERLIMSLS